MTETSTPRDPASLTTLRVIAAVALVAGLFLSLAGFATSIELVSLGGFLLFVSVVSFVGYLVAASVRAFLRDAGRTP